MIGKSVFKPPILDIELKTNFQKLFMCHFRVLFQFLIDFHASELNNLLNAIVLLFNNFFLLLLRDSCLFNFAHYNLIKEMYIKLKINFDCFRLCFRNEVLCSSSIGPKLI